MYLPSHSRVQSSPFSLVRLKWMSGCETMRACQKIRYRIVLAVSLQQELAIQPGCGQHKCKACKLMQKYRWKPWRITCPEEQLTHRDMNLLHRAGSRAPSELRAQFYHCTGDPQNRVLGQRRLGARCKETYLVIPVAIMCWSLQICMTQILSYTVGYRQFRTITYAISWCIPEEFLSTEVLKPNGLQHWWL